MLDGGGGVDLSWCGGGHEERGRGEGKEREKVVVVVCGRHGLSVQPALGTAWPPLVRRFSVFPPRPMDPDPEGGLGNRLCHVRNILSIRPSRLSVPLDQEMGGAGRLFISEQRKYGEAGLPSCARERGEGHEHMASSTARHRAASRLLSPRLAPSDPTDDLAVFLDTHVGTD